MSRKIDFSIDKSRNGKFIKNETRRFELLQGQTSGIRFSKDKQIN
jgi:hypothetical protein